VIDLQRLDWPTLNGMYEAAAEVLNCQRVLAKTGDNVVGDILRHEGTFYAWNHYPAGDVYDPETHSQYYYHAHPEDQRADGEHGHFHTFLRPDKAGIETRPAALPDADPAKAKPDHVTHLVGLSMSRAGRLVRLFTTNRWVTGETWYDAEGAIGLIDRFVIDHARPSWPANRWVTGVLRLYRPHIAELLRRRDRAIAEHAAAYPDVNVYEDRSLEVTSELWTSLEDFVIELEDAMQEAARQRAAEAAAG
jgi:hypothetical protein